MPDDQSGKPTKILGVRMPISEISEFYALVRGVGWDKDDVMRKLIRSTTELLKAKRRPEWPILVVDSLDEDGSSPDGRAVSELKKEMQRLTDWHLKEVEKIVKEAAGGAFDEKVMDLLKKSRGSVGRGKGR
jgi:uncharacterized protein (UPF0335 family)